MTKALVSLSGGLDSGTALAVARDMFRDVVAVSFQYPSKHNVYEREAACRLAKYYKVPLVKVDLSALFESFRSDLLKSGGEVPEGHYEAETMRATVVPGRNLIFLAVLAGLAESQAASSIVLGVHAGDHHIYPDCRPEFIQAARRVVELSSADAPTPVGLTTPFLSMTKAEIVRAGLKWKVPYELTRTCYKDQPTACGKCGSCVERREAFRLCGAVDPILYEFDGPLPEKPVVRSD